jgi:hypothetical protein
MDTSRILAELRSKRQRLDQAIAALEGLDTGITPGRKRVGRPAGSGQTGPKRRGGPRHMSAAARKRISEKMKLRWAERKKAGR